MRIALLLFFFVSCQSKETSVSPAIKKEGEYFSPHEVVSAINALTAIIDWPQDTIEQQKNLMITPESAKTLILPLHPLWNEKVEEVASQISTWDKTKISNVAGDCLKRCECEFYQEVIQKAGLELGSFAGLKAQKTKSDILNCLKFMPSLQKIRSYLEKERKDYEAESH